MKQQQQERSVLIDITNDSPIVGLATGTPSSALAKQRSSRAMNMTPGSGEALLRGQVKTLLQKVEEEAQLSKLPLESRPFLNLQCFAHSPAGLVAPTPANTPQVADLLADASVVEEGMNMAQVMNQEIVVSRSLLLDFSEKSECSSVVEEDSCSVWSIEGNASMKEEEEEEVVDGLCEGLSKLIVTLPRFEGKHKRFVYNSDGEMEGAEEVAVEDVLATPKGKHLRFPDEEEED